MMRKTGKRMTAAARLLSCALLLCVCCGCGNKAPELLEPVGSGDNLVTAVKGEMYNTIVTQTTVIPSTRYVRMKNQGVVAGLPVGLGDHVKEGDVLVELDSQGVSGQVEELDSQIAEKTADNEYLNNLAQLRIQIAELELAQMQANGAGADEIAEKNSEIADQRDRLYTQQIEQEKELAALQMQKMEGGVSGSPLVAPCDGTVVALRAGNVGDTIESGTVAAVAVEGSKEIKGDYVTEEVLNAAHEYYALINGKRYEITPSPYSPEELALLGMTEGTPYSTYYLNEGDDVAYGDMAVVIVVTDYKENALYIPDNALYSDVDSYYVYLQDENGKRKRQDVEIGFEWNNAVEITAGLEEGAVLYAK